MNQNKLIQYKAIFKQNGDTESIQYQSKGIFQSGKETRLTFDIPENTIDISYSGHKICLKYGYSILNLDLEKEIWNQYQLPYGSVLLKTKVLLFEANHQHIKLKYQLHDQQALISTVYILITMSSLEDA